MFIRNVWSKLKKDAQHQLKEVQDWTVYLEYLQSILLEFDANNAPGEIQLGRYFYDGLKLSIKLLIANIREEMLWDHLVSAANKVEAKIKI